MKTNIELSKFLSLILRHKPEVVGLKLKDEGWVNVTDLINGINHKSSFNIDFNILENIVNSDNKGRYSFDDDMENIRANQGHSAKINMTFNEVIPSLRLYHGTHVGAIDSILKYGISKRSRHHVHLTSDVHMAKKVGSRRGEPVILAISAELMYMEGHKFYRSENGVYLVDHVPANRLWIDNGW